MQIKAKQVSHIYDKSSTTEFKALEGVSVAFEQGEMTAIIGHTGSGKTTFIEHLNALARPTTGSVELAYEVKEAPRKGAALITKQVTRTIMPGRKKMRFIKEVRSRIGIAFQFAEYQLFEDTILKDIIFGPLNLKVPKPEAIELAKKYIKIVGLDESYLPRSPFALSGGQKRRVALAGILAMNPDFLVLDEPTAGLDPQGTKDMYEIFKKIHAEGKTIIIVTHNLDLVLEHTKRTLMFRHGKLIRDAASLDLMYEADFLSSNELEPPKLASLVAQLEATGQYQIGKVRTIDELSKRLAAQYHARHGTAPTTPNGAGTAAKSAPAPQLKAALRAKPKAEPKARAAKKKVS